MWAHNIHEEKKLFNETNKKQPVKMLDVKLTILQHWMLPSFQFSVSYQFNVTRTNETDSNQGYWVSLRSLQISISENCYIPRYTYFVSIATPFAYCTHYHFHLHAIVCVSSYFVSSLDFCADKPYTISHARKLEIKLCKPDYFMRAGDDGDCIAFSMQLHLDRVCVCVMVCYG